MTTENSENAEKPKVAPRSPLNAVLLSLVMTGLGQIYCGQLIAGLAWAAVGAICGVVSLIGLTQDSYSILLTSLPMFAASVGSACHAWGIASQCPKDYQLKVFNHWKVYMLVGVISTAGAAGYGLMLRSHVVVAYVIPTNSMHPTLQKGDRFLVDKTAYQNEIPEVDDIIVFKNPEKPWNAFVKRVVALENDTVEIRDGELLINGEVSSPPADGVMNDVQDFGPVVVPKNHLFVMGDARAKSKDSRHFGPISVVSVEGEVTRVFWPLAVWFGRSTIK